MLLTGVKVRLEILKKGTVGRHKNYQDSDMMKISNWATRKIAGTFDMFRFCLSWKKHVDQVTAQSSLLASELFSTFTKGIHTGVFNVEVRTLNNTQGRGRIVWHSKSNNFNVPSVNWQQNHTSQNKHGRDWSKLGRHCVEQMLLG